MIKLFLRLFLYTCEHNCTFKIKEYKKMYYSQIFKLKNILIDLVK